MTNSSNKKIIGITGTQGAGKDTAADFFIQKGYTHFSLSDIVREEAAARGMEPTRDNWRIVGDELRAQYGNNVLGMKTREKIDESSDRLFVVTSFRHPGEVAAIRDVYTDFTLLAIDAPIELRYERITGRGNHADNVSFEVFKAQEEKENVTTDVGMRIREVMQLADEIIQNDTDMNHLFKKLESYVI